MKAKLFDVFTGEEIVDVKLDKFLSKRLAEKRVPGNFELPLHNYKPEHGERVLVLDHGELVDAVYNAIGTEGYWWFQDWKTNRSFWKTDGWVREEELP